MQTTLSEEYSNEEKPSNGEIYRKVWQYEREGNVYFKKRWKARLSDHGRRGLQQLRDHGDGELAAAFDSLLDIPGLWDGMRISTGYTCRRFLESTLHDISLQACLCPSMGTLS